MKTQWFVLGIALLLVLSACDQAATTEVDADAQADADTQADADADVDVRADVDTNVDLSADAEEYLELLMQKSSMEWKVDYNIATTMEGATINSKMSMYLKGEDVRTDMTIPLYGETRSYFVDEELVTCRKSDGAWSCTKYSAPEEDDTEPDQTDIEEDILEDASDYQIKADGTMSIAGTTAKCFLVVSKEDTEDVTLRQCYSDEGAPLYILMASSTDGYEYRSEMKATAYSERVTSADLAFPAEPKEFDVNAGFGASGTVEAGSGDNCAACEGLEGDARDMCLAYC